ncbi:RICIN domain-containing protein [Lentzea jiangxiensis]
MSAGQIGSFTLRHVATGEALDVNRSSFIAGPQLQQWTANNGTNQR